VRQAERKRETRPTPAETLTPRERQIVRGISSGESNREMAERLGLSEGTIKAHVTAIYDKLGVSNRAELAAVAVTHHLADDPPNASAGSST
jgi:DNA-binding NarL/FixJ family response regulator